MKTETRTIFIADDGTEEPIYENRPQGSDFFNPVYVGSRTKEYPCWKRTCTICGKTEATTTTEPVVTEYRPKF